MAKTFEQTYAETGRQSELDRLRQTGQYASAKAAWQRSQGISPTPSPATTALSTYKPYAYTPSAKPTAEMGPIDIAREMYGLGRQFVDPAMQRLEQTRAAIPTQFAETTRRLEAEREPLKARYQNLLADITKQTQLATTREFARRGISPTSGIVEQAMGARMGPQIERIGLEREAGLRDITNLLAQVPVQEQQAQADLDRAIATILGGAGPTAMQYAMDLYGQEQAARRAEEAATWERPFAERMYEYELARPYAGEEAGAGAIPDWGSLYQQFERQFGGGIETPAAGIGAGAESDPLGLLAGKQFRPGFATIMGQEALRKGDIAGAAQYYA